VLLPIFAYILFQVYHLRVQVLPLVPGEVCQVHQQERLHHVRHEGAFLLTLLLPVSLTHSVKRYHYGFFVYRY
jgi:hypothetical protein